LSSSSGSSFLQSSLYQLLSIELEFNNETNMVRGDVTSATPYVLDRVDDPSSTPYSVRGRGSWYYTNIHQLEHTADQLEYLVNDANILPHQFLEIAYVINYMITPIVASAVGGPNCVYSSRTNYQDCRDSVRRNPYILSFDMAKMLMGTHNRLVYMPVQVPRSLQHPHALNQNLDFGKIEESFLRGEVSERSERALRKKTRIVAMNPAKWLQT